MQNSHHLAIQARVPCRRLLLRLLVPLLLPMTTGNEVTFFGHAHGRFGLLEFLYAEYLVVMKMK